MSDVVYCHMCYNKWFREEWGLICPYCEDEATEIVVVNGDPPTVEEVFGTAEAPAWVDEAFGTAETPAFLADDAEPGGPRSWDYGGRITKEEMRLRKYETRAEGSNRSNGSTEEPLREVVIAVMGVTGSGKSTFIRTMTGNNDVHVGHGLESDTSEVNSYRFTNENTEFVLVDTPGFDDTSCSDEEIMTRVLQWLDTSYRSGTRLNGLIYLHRIVDPKMQGSARNNMRMFCKLCGPECFGNVILATTFWNSVPAELGAKREKELINNDEFWGKMVKKGSKVERLSTDKDSGMKLLLEIAKKNKITLESQREMVEENKSAEETAAAQSVHEEVVRQKEEFERKIEEQRLENERELARQTRKRQRALNEERRAAAARERERAILQAQRKKDEEAAWKAEYERKQREVREAEAAVERERQRLAAIEKRKQEAAEAYQREQDRFRAERQSHYENYSCQRWNVSGLTCDKCSTSIRNAYYYHCCFCYGDNYDQCDSCGACCPVLEHPVMTRRFKSEPRKDDDCIVM